MLRPCFFWMSHTCQHCVFLFGFLSLRYSTVQPDSSGLSSANARSRPTFVFKLPTLLPPTSYLPPLHLHPFVSFCFLIPPASSSSYDSFKVLKKNVGGLQSRSAELLHFIASHAVDLIYSGIQPQHIFLGP